MTKQDALWLANERYKKDKKSHIVYNRHTIEGYFVDNYVYGSTVYRILGKSN